jgi:hypothetical protein
VTLGSIGRSLVVYTTRLANGIYIYIEIKKGDKWKIAFRTLYRHFKYLVIPFRLTNVPATFQWVIDYIIQPFLNKFVVYYIDNILIFSKILEEHWKYIRAVLDVLFMYKLLVNKDKSEFYIKKTVFLGFEILLGKVYIELIKIEAI